MWKKRAQINHKPWFALEYVRRVYSLETGANALKPTQKNDMIGSTENKPQYTLTYRGIET